MIGRQNFQKIAMKSECLRWHRLDLRWSKSAQKKCTLSIIVTVLQSTRSVIIQLRPQKPPVLFSLQNWSTPQEFRLQSFSYFH